MSVERPRDEGERGLLGLDWAREVSAIETVEGVRRRVEPVPPTVAGDDSRRLALDLDDIGIELERS
jgi:hypothetical protein